LRQIGVIGGGILGLAVAHRISEIVPDVAITVVEKEDELATHQTGHSSGVVHAGIYYQPGSLKAAMCTQGSALLRRFCFEHDIPVEEVGKFVVATDKMESKRLDDIEARARANGVPGLRRLNKNELAEIEPEVVGDSALHSPHTAIVDFQRVARALGNVLERSGHTILTGQRVDRLRKRARDIDLITSRESFRFDHVIICAGLGTNNIMRILDDNHPSRILPVRGEYYRLNESVRHLVRGLVYPVPDPRYPFLGVHFTRRIDGEVFIGPNAVFATALEGYRRRDLNVKDLADFLAWPGTWRLARKNVRTGIYELAGSLSRRVFVDRARRYVPRLEVHDVTSAPAGVRAQAVDRHGDLIDDFIVCQTNVTTCVRNAPSPGATSSMAFARHIVDSLPAL
jgi:L-2-hydroxyglutarate oxidase LhgO